MISRRQVIGYGAAASALGVAGRWTHRPSRPALPVALVVVDERFDLARTVAGSLGLPNVPRVVLPRDLLGLWHGQLSPVLRTGRQAIAGVTTERGFFLLRTLAADQRARVLSRTDQGSLVSWLLGPK